MEHNGGGGPDGALNTRHWKRRGGPRCYNCQKYGHIQRNCREELHKNRKEEKSRMSGRNKDRDPKHKANPMKKETDSSLIVKLD